MAKPRVHTTDQIKAFVEELKGQSDRGTAIVACAVLEELSEMVLLARFIELSRERKEAIFDKIGAPLSTFSAKIELAYALGIIRNEARLGLHLMRDVRNKFAHRIDPLKFDDPEITRMIDSRGSQAVKSMKGNTREKYLAMFSALATILYGTIAIDIRIRPLEETHQEDFLRLIQMAIEAAGLLD